MRLCPRLRISEPVWLDDPAISDRVAVNRNECPSRQHTDPE